MNLGITKKELDIEWIKLIKEAKASGFTKEEIQEFLCEFKEDSDAE